MLGYDFWPKRIELDFVSDVLSWISNSRWSILCFPAATTLSKQFLNPKQLSRHLSIFALQKPLCPPSNFALHQLPIIFVLLQSLHSENFFLFGSCRVFWAVCSPATTVPFDHFFFLAVRTLFKQYLLSSNRCALWNFVGSPVHILWPWLELPFLRNHYPSWLMANCFNVHQLLCMSSSHTCTKSMCEALWQARTIN